MKLVLVQYPAINRYVIMRRDGWEAVRLEYPLVFEFENLEWFLRDGRKLLPIWIRFPSGVFEPLTRKRIMPIANGVLEIKSILVEQPNGDLTLVYEPKGGFKV